jgi:hypothetical protein
MLLQNAAADRRRSIAVREALFARANRIGPYLLRAELKAAPARL